jgi:hypothetical protein
MKNKHCSWCDHNFQTNISYQIYCSAECREAATKEKIAERYKMQKAKKRAGKPRKCKNCDGPMSMYNDDVICQKCQINPEDVNKILKEIKGIANGKIEF